MNTFSNPHIKRSLVILFVIVIGLHIAHGLAFNESATRIPGVSQGRSRTFTGEMGLESRISAIDTTEEYIYIAYSTHGVVAVYDWDGVYQYSIAFFSDTNGTLGMRCEDGLLYVCDYAGYEFVFSGEERMAVYAPAQRNHTIAWFHEAKELPLMIQDGNIYTDAGGFIMELPGK